MYEYKHTGGHIAAGSVIGYSNNQRVAKVITEEKYESGRLVSKTVTTEYVYEQPQINVTNNL